MPETKKPNLQSLRFDKEWPKEYRRLVENQYREHAASTIQRTFRAIQKIKKTKTISPASLFRKTGARKSDSILNLTQEPTDNKYLEHVEKIKIEDYKNLDFNDPEFILNLLKALRLKEIDINQMLMAQSVYEAREWLHDYDYNAPQLREFDYAAHPIGPYQASGISYSTPEQITKFYENLDEDNKKYLIINFSKWAEAAFFYYGLGIDDKKFSINSLDSDFAEGLVRYISHLPAITDAEKKDFLSYQQAGKVYNDTEKAKIKLLIEKAMFPLTIKNSSKKDKESMQFLRAILAVHEETPSFALSPDYKIDDPNTPTLCFVLTTLEAEKQLQLAVHGSEATLAQPVAGEFPTRVIRALDEQPELSKKHTPAENRKFSAEELHQLKTATDSDVMHAVYSPLYGQKQSRPVQTYHPNFESKIKPHGYDTSNFMLTWHDRFHCWRNGANFKMFIYHERKLFTRKGACQEKNFVMSKALWELTDMDYSHGRQIRLAIKSNDPSRIEKAYFDYVFGVLDKLEISPNSDLHYLHIIDIIKNPDAWKHFLNYPEDDEKEFHEIMENVLTRSSNRVAKIFEATFRNKELIDLVEKNSEKTNESIILRCKLKSIKNSEFLCDAIDSLDIRRFFYWGANSGLIIHESLRLEIKKYCDCDKFNLDEFGAGTLSKVLLICVKQLSESEYKNLLKKIITKRFIREMIEENQFYFLTSLKGSGIELEILENALSETNTNLFKILYSDPDSLEKIADNITYEIEIAAMLFRLKSEDFPENSVKKIQEKIINNSAITRTILKEIASETRFNSVLLLAFSRNDSVINKAILNNAHCSSELAKRVIIELNNDYFNFNPEELAREKNFIMLSWLALISENETLLNKILLLTLKAEISEKERTEIQANLIRNKEKGAKYCWILCLLAEKTSDIDTILLKYIKENEKDPEKINDIILFKGGVYLSKPSEKILSELIKKTSAEEALRFLFLEVKRRTKTQNFVMTEEIETAQANFAENPNTPNNILEALAENTKNLTLLVKISERDYSEYPHSILISVAKNSHTSTEILSTLYKKTIDREVLTEIAKNANCDPELKKEIESLNALKDRVTHEIQNHIKEISTNQDPCFFKTRNNVSEANRLIKKINCSKNFNELQEQIIIGKAYSEGLELGLSHPPFWKNTYAECLSRCLKIIDKPKAEKALRGK